MHLKTKAPKTAKSILKIRELDEHGDQVTEVKIGPAVDVGVRDGYLCFWTAGREVRVGPLSPEQAELLCEDLGYESVV